MGVATWLLALSFGLIDVYRVAVGDTNWHMVAYQSMAAIGSGPRDGDASEAGLCRRWSKLSNSPRPCRGSN